MILSRKAVRKSGILNAVRQSFAAAQDIDFGVKPFKKGLVGVERAKPFVCTGNRYSHFFTTAQTFLFALFRAAEPKILSQIKKCAFRKCFQGGDLSCRSPPLWGTVPRTVLQIHPLPSALRVSASEVVKKCACRYRVQMRGFAPSIPTSL